MGEQPLCLSTVVWAAMLQPSREANMSHLGVFLVVFCTLRQEHPSLLGQLAFSQKRHLGPSC